MQRAFADLEKPDARMQQAFAGLEKHDARVQQAFAGLEKPDAAVQQASPDFAGVVAGIMAAFRPIFPALANAHTDRHPASVVAASLQVKQDVLPPASAL